MTAKTKAEKLADANAAIAEAQGQANALMLDSAQAAKAALTGPKVEAFLADVQSALADTLDDLARPAGQPSSAEGSKQSLQRIVSAIEAGRAMIDQRIEKLSPPVTPAAAPEPTA
jgi:cob(I)alamin adenosyltransferase